MRSGTYWCDIAVVDGAPQERVTIAIEAGRIGRITPDSVCPPTAMRLRGVTVAGFANAHSHAFHRALRGRTQRDRGSFWTWRELMYRATERLDPDRYHRLAVATFAEMAMAGVSAVGEFHYVHHRPDGTPYANPNAMGEALLAAATTAGLRITLLDSLYLHRGIGAYGYQPVAGAQLMFSDRTTERWCDRVDQLVADEGQLIGASVHSVRAVDPMAIAVVAEWSRERDIVVHAHVSEQPAENEACQAINGSTPVEVFSEAGLTGPRFTAVHGTHLSDRDVELLGHDRTFVCFCPTTERDLGDGIGPSAGLVRAGARLCLGSDSHAMIDLLEEARAVELDERLLSRERGTHDAQSLLEMATVNGQSSLGWADAGILRVGARADLTTISLDSVRTAGGAADLPIETAVFAASAADVSNVVVDGSTVVRDGQHVSIDVAAELQLSIADLFDE